jgi:hypothetical protein
MTQDKPVLICEECGEETDRLLQFTWERPRLKRCRKCYNKKEKEERDRGRVCGKCGAVRLNCCC